MMLLIPHTLQPVECRVCLKVTQPSHRNLHFYVMLLCVAD